MEKGYPDRLWTSNVSRDPRARLNVGNKLYELTLALVTSVSNSTFDRGSLSPTYGKPFDVLAKGSETGDWLLGLDSNQQPSG